MKTETIHIHVDEIKAMAQRAHSDATYRELLFATMQGDDIVEAVHAAWTLTHLPKEDNLHIASHRNALVQLAITTSNISLRRITLTLLNRIEFPLPDSLEETPPHYIDLLDFCLTHMMMPDEPYGVRSLCMKIAYTLSLPYPELLGELRQSLLLIEPTELGRGVLHTRNAILQLTNRH